MTFDSRHRPWLMGCGTAGFVCTIAYILYSFNVPHGPRGGTTMGLAFGILGTGIIIFEALLSLRKRYPASPFGRVQSWLRAHLYLGMLSMLLILFHTGFHWGRGLAWVLMWMMALVGVSGVVGAILQAYIPRRMRELVTRETLFDQIPRMVRQLRQEADERVEFITADLGFAEEPEPEEVFSAGGKKFYFDPAQRKSAQEKVDAEIQKRKKSPQIVIPQDAVAALKTHYLQEMRPYLQEKPTPFSRRLLGTPESLSAYFRHLRTILPVAAHTVLDDLADICEDRRQLSVQARLHKILHGWLYIHVPLSMGVLVLTLFHAVISLRY